jgi:hypothetical protein
MEPPRGRPRASARGLRRGGPVLGGIRHRPEVSRRGAGRVRDAGRPLLQGAHAERSYQPIHTAAGSGGDGPEGPHLPARPAVREDPGRPGALAPGEAWPGHPRRPVGEAARDRLPDEQVLAGRRCAVDRQPGEDAGGPVAGRTAEARRSHPGGPLLPGDLLLHAGDALRLLPRGRWLQGMGSSTSVRPESSGRIDGAGAGAGTGTGTGAGAGGMRPPRPRKGRRTVTHAGSIELGLSRPAGRGRPSPGSRPPRRRGSGRVASRRVAGPRHRQSPERTKAAQ